MAYADVELLLITWLKTRHASVRFVTELPAGLASVLPVVQVLRFGGSDTDLTLDAPNVDINVHAADLASANALAEAIRSDIRVALPGYTTGGATVARTETISGPKWVPYDNTNLRRNNASYRVTVHAAP